MWMADRAAAGGDAGSVNDRAGAARTHRWSIAEREYRRQEARRGRRHAYTDIDPEATALVVIDMVEFFLDSSPYARSIVPAVNQIATSLRRRGGLVVWVVPRSRRPTPWEVNFYGSEVAAVYAGSGGDGDPRDRPWPGLDVHPDDICIDKSERSAFFPGSCGLPDLLSAAGVDTVVIAGTVTSVCCESSARDASALSYRVVVVADATADIADRPHNAALRTIYRSFGDVRPAAELLDLIG